MMPSTNTPTDRDPQAPGERPDPDPMTLGWLAAIAPEVTSAPDYTDAFLRACAEADRLGLRLLPPRLPSRRAGQRGVIRPFFVVQDPETHCCQEVYFSGLDLECNCGATPWCAHKATVWRSLAGEGAVPTC